MLVQEFDVQLALPVCCEHVGTRHVEQRIGYSNNGKLNPVHVSGRSVGRYKLLAQPPLWLLMSGALLWLDWCSHFAVECRN